MKICLSQATIQGTPTLKALESAAHAGFEHIDLWWPQVWSEAGSCDPATIRQRCEADGITAASLSVPNVDLAGGEQTWIASEADLRAAIDFARHAGIGLICLAPSANTGPATAEAVYGLAAERLARIIERPEAAAIAFALEFQRDSGWLTSLPSTLALVSLFDPDRLGICFDAFHYYCGPSKFEDLTPAAIGRVRSVQLSDLIGTTREFAVDADRILPGEGDFDLRSILGCFRAADYDDLICVESPNPMLWQFAPDRVADMAHQSVLRFFATDAFDPQP